MPEFEIEVFKRRLAETIAWCQPRLSTDENQIPHCLRTPPEPPDNMRHKLSGYRLGDPIILKPDLENIEGFLETLFQKRAASFSETDLPNFQGLGGGRLLVNELAGTCEGTSPPETIYFIDDCDIPAWDTWVWYGKIGRYPYLISWIPKELHAFVEEAIYFNSMELLFWVENSEQQLPFFAEIQAAGLFME